MNYTSDFDLDLSIGIEGEQKLLEMLTISTIEVKTDYLAAKTGNIAVEFYSRGWPSGIAVTKAKHWAFVIPDKGVFIIETDRLKTLARKYYKLKRIKFGGDNNSSHLVLIPITELFND
jgi:hypothetical protein